MSSLVFVQDAQGRPLMPMSAAYARTLIQRGKATVRPHPAFSVIQLTRVVAAPTLRPVLVGIALNTTTADLIVAIDQLRGSPSTIHMVVDLQVPRSWRHLRRGRWELPRQRMLHKRARPFQYPRDRVHLLLAVLKAWQAVVPISHLVLLPSARSTALIPPEAWWIEQRVAAGIRRLGSPVSVAHRHTKLSGEVPYWLLRHLEEQMIWSVHQSPQLVACAASKHEWLDPERRFSIRGRWERRSSSLPCPIRDRSRYTRGPLYTARYQRRTITGVLRTFDPPDQLILRVPTQVTDQGVQWQSIAAPITALVQTWPPTPILLLPLVRA